MESKRLLIPILLICFLILILMTGCTSEDIVKNNVNNMNQKIDIYTTLYVLEEFSQRIGGDLVNVVNLTPRGASPHNYEPSAKDITLLMESDIFIYNGAGLELWLDKVIENIDETDVKVVNASNNIDLMVGIDDKHSEFSGKINNYDPHVWLDPLNALKLAEEIKQILITVDPDNQTIFEKNYMELEKELYNLNDEYCNELSNIKYKEFFVSHAAFGYLAKRYGLEQQPITGIILEDEPSPLELANIIDKAKVLDIKYILLDPKDEIKIAQIVAEEIGAKTEQLYNISSPSNEELESGLDYYEMMKKNLQVLKLALNE